MEREITALLVHDQAEHMHSLEEMLQRQGIAVQQAGTCQAAAAVLERAPAPQLILTDTNLPDGRWTDLIVLAGTAPQPVNVIVVARFMDTQLYIEAIEGGAFDFIVPPFTTRDLAHVVRCAADNARDRREASQRPLATDAPPLFASVSTPLRKAGTPNFLAEANDSLS